MRIKKKGYIHQKIKKAMGVESEPEETEDEKLFALKQAIYSSVGLIREPPTLLEEDIAFSDN
jgi:hypothetical protein